MSKNPKINFQKSNGLTPVVIQDEKTMDVLMLGYMNKGALEKTTSSGLVHFWSRRRKKLWRKGEESGNKLKVKNIFTDCDSDALLIQVKVMGRKVCHKGRKGCFHQMIL